MPVYWICSPSLSGFSSVLSSRLEIGGIVTWFEFLDGEFACLTVAADGFVDSAICSTANETDDFVAVDDSDFALISNIGTYAPITRI